MMPPDGLDGLAAFDAIFLGAVGFPGVPDHVSLWGLLIPIRRHFRQYVNLRPVRVLAGMVSPLRDRGPEDIDFYVVRENNEGEYSEIGGRLYEGTDHEMAMQESVFTPPGRWIGSSSTPSISPGRAARSTSPRRPSRTASSTPCPIGTSASRRWRSATRMCARPGTTWTSSPRTSSSTRTGSTWWWEAICSATSCPDLGPAIAGTIGIAPSANINPERELPSMFEPVHGSAPDIAGAKASPTRSGRSGRGR